MHAPTRQIDAIERCTESKTKVKREATHLNVTSLSFHCHPGFFAVQAFL